MLREILGTIAALVELVGAIAVKILYAIDGRDSRDPN